LDFPFLVDGFESVAARREEIAQEVVRYLAAQGGDPIPGYEGAGEVVPEPYVWWLRIEKWGLPHGQGLVAEPCHFMNDIEWAGVGQQRHYNAMAFNAANKKYEEAA